MKVARVVWPALGKGWSRSDVVVARLDRFFDQDSVRRGEDGEPGKTVRELARRMCAEGGDAELARLHAYLVRRAAAGAGEVPPGTLAADTEAGRCRVLRRRE